MNKLLQIQAELKAPKNQFNKFGNYKYRNVEDILESVKPLCVKHDVTLTISDEMVMVGDRIYVKATATIQDGDMVKSVSAFAREPESQKGMADPQITGSASSYARKYALNGLFLIDDTKDADFTNTHGKEQKQVSNPDPQNTGRQVAQQPQRTVQSGYQNQGYQQEQRQVYHEPALNDEMNTPYPPQGGDDSTMKQCTQCGRNIQSKIGKTGTPYHRCFDCGIFL